MKDLRTSLKLTLVAFLASALTTAVLYSVLDGSEWFARSLGAVALVAVVGGSARAARFPRPLIPLVQAAGVLIYLTSTYVPDDANSGWLPGPAALRSLRTLGNSAFDEVDTLAPPITPSPALTFLIVTGVALMAILVDALAGYRQTALAGLPLLTLYIVPAVVLPNGVDGALFLLPAVGYLLLLITDSRERLLRWGVAVSGRSGEAPARSPGELGQMTRRIGLSVLSMSLAIPALAPQLTHNEFGGGGIGNDPSGGGTIETLNPIITMRRDLVRPADVDLLRVRTDSAHADELYLRAVTLDTFDGVEWRAGRRAVDKFNSSLPDAAGLPDSIASTPVNTTVTVGDKLETDYVPMPYPATKLDIDGTWRVDPLTGNVVSRDGAGQLTGKAYGVKSLDLDPKASDVTPSLAIEPYLKPYLELPADLPQRVKDIAARVTKGSDTVLGQAIALQQWFRDPDNFTYDLRQRPGTGKDAIIAFLNDRRGYCEQFAATMAVMARQIGIPARINVGFTPGAPQPDGTRVISAHDAHAWPELFMPGVGWTRFEPTPGSATSNPNVPDWLAPAPAKNNPSEGTDPGDEPDDSQPQDSGLTGAAPQPEDVNPSPGPGELPDPASSTVPEADPAHWYDHWKKISLWSLLVLALLAAPALIRLSARRRRWYLVGSTTDAAVAAEAAWRELGDTVVDLGFGWPEARTPRQTSLALSGEGGLAPAGSDAMAMITQFVERVRYAPGGSANPGRDQLHDAVNDVRRELAATAGRGRRLRARVLPPSVSAIVSGAVLRMRDRGIAARHATLRTLRARRA